MLPRARLLRMGLAVLSLVALQLPPGSCGWFDDGGSSDGAARAGEGSCAAAGGEGCELLLADPYAVLGVSKGADEAAVSSRV